MWLKWKFQRFIQKGKYNAGNDYQMSTLFLFDGGRHYY